MTVPVEVLRQLHRVHQQLADLQGRLTRGPKLIRMGQKAVQDGEQKHAAAKELLKQTRMVADGLQLQLRQREDKLKDLQRKLNECKTNTEYKTLQDQIAAEKQADSVLEDEILEKLERLDAVQQEIGTASDELKQMQSDFEKTRQRVEAERDSLESEVARVSAELEETEKRLPPDIRAEYRRMVKAKGPEALAPVESETCGGCYQTLTPQTMNELSMSRLVFCKSCGCLLYLPEDRSVGAKG
jgi:predicted  nucleic acid-binding Zn-ribbon protein